MKTVISVLVWCSVFFAVVAVWHFSHQIYFSGNRIGGPMGGMVEDPNDLALWLVMMIPFAWQRYRLAETKPERLLNLGIIMCYLAGIFVSYSRGGFLGLLAILGVYFLRLPGNKRFSALIGVSAVIVILAFLLPKNYAERMDSIVHTERDETGSAAVRFQTMQVSVEEAFNHPVFGSGIGMNLLALQESGKFNPTVFVHSAPLQVVSELGFPALFVYVYLFYSTFKTMKGIRKNLAFKTDGKLMNSYAGAIEASLWGFVVSGFFLPVAYRWYSFYIIGLASALISILKQSPPIAGRLSNASKG
jgi:putative inorganic carbon (HCO3(-)) transporter